MALKTPQRRRVQNKTAEKPYDFSIWTDTTKDPWSAIKRLTIDDAVAGFYKAYRATYGRLIPMDLVERIEGLAAMCKKAYRPQLNLKMTPGYEDLTRFITAAEARGEKVEIVLADLKGKP